VAPVLRTLAEATTNGIDGIDREAKIRIVVSAGARLDRVLERLRDRNISVSPAESGDHHVLVSVPAKQLGDLIARLAPLDEVDSIAPDESDLAPTLRHDHALSSRARNP